MNKMVTYSVDSDFEIELDQNTEVTVVLGLHGAEGTQGPPGVKGDKGDVGPTGPVGLTGPAGAIGPSGPTGSTGAAGPSGSAGAAGPAGPVGPTGPQGIQGIKGDTGAGVRVRGSVPGLVDCPTTGNALGDGFILTDFTPDHLAVCTALPNTWTDVGVFQGPIGATGPAGPAGPTGPGGPAGATGPQGIQGPSGPGVPAAGTVGHFLRKNAAGVTDTGWAAVDKALVGLSNVDNTSDASKTAAFIAAPHTYTATQTFGDTIAATLSVTGTSTLTGAAASGGGISTVGVTGGNKGAGTINATTLYQAGVLLEDVPFKASNVAALVPPTSRSSKQRWSNTVDVMDYGADPTNSPTFHTALTNAFNEAKARGLSEIRIPPGQFRLGDTCTLVNLTPDGDRIRFIGSGRTTIITANFSNKHWFQIGETGATDPTATHTVHLSFEKMDFGVTVTNATAGAVFNLRNSRYCSWRECAFVGVRQAFRLGCPDITGGTGPTAKNDVGSILFANCSFVNGSDHTLAHMIELGSGGTLIVEGNYLPFINGIAPAIPGLALFAQTHATYNWDGLFVKGFNGSDWYYYVLAQAGGTGGLVNFAWDGGGFQLDGGTRAFLATGGVSRDWLISNCFMIFGVASTAVDGYPLDWNAPGLVVMQNCVIMGYTHYIYARSGTVNVIGCTFEGSGRGSTDDPGPHPLVRFAAPDGIVAGCSYVPIASEPVASSSVAWSGVTTGYRYGPGSSPAPFNGFRNLTHTGTP